MFHAGYGGLLLLVVLKWTSSTCRNTSLRVELISVSHTVSAMQLQSQLEHRGIISFVIIHAPGTPRVEGSVLSPSINSHPGLEETVHLFLRQVLQSFRA